jgi:hypothetical protein
MRCTLLTALVAAATAAARAPRPPAGIYSLTQKQDILIHFGHNGSSNTTVGKVDLSAFNPVATQLSTIVEKTATLYVLALNKTYNNETSIVGISLADASVTGVYPTPLKQDPGTEVGQGMTIDAYGRHGLVISGVDRTSQKHTAYTVDPAKGHAVQKLSDGFLDGAMPMLDAPHCVDVESSALWLVTPSKNYSASGLDLVGIDLTKGTELGRHTLPSTQMVHAVRHDPHAGGLVALGLDAATFKPFVFTIDTSTFKPTIVAGFDAYSVFNGIAAWDPLRRTIYGMALVSKTVRDPMLVSFSLAGQQTLYADICQDGAGCDAPFNIDFFPGALE